MFDLNRRAIIPRIGRRFITNIYIPVYHTNRRSIKNMIGVVVNRLVGMGLKGCCCRISELRLLREFLVFEYGQFKYT